MLEKILVGLGKIMNAKKEKEKNLESDKMPGKKFREAEKCRKKILERRKMLGKNSCRPRKNPEC